MQASQQNWQQKITEAQAEQARKILSGISVQVGETDKRGSMQAALNEIGKKLADPAIDELVKNTVMAALKMSEIVQLELDHETEISNAVAALKQKNIEIQNSVALEKKKSRKRYKRVRDKGKNGKRCRFVTGRINAHGQLARKIKESLMGEAANLKVINDALKDQGKLELKSNALRAKIYEDLVKQSRDSTGQSRME